MTDDRAPSEGTPVAAGLAARITADADALDHELAEIDLLVGQVRAEAARHEQKRAQAAERAGAVPGTGEGRGDAKALVAAYEQLVTLTRRAVLMDAQVEVLEGKRKALARHRDALRSLATVAAAAPPDDAGTAEPRGRPGGEERPAGEAATDGLPPPLSRAVLAAQEDLRREIARALHDGPAQSLTNITLQSQILERTLARHPDQAPVELQRLMRMVQQTLDATKRFIFDVRPMVLDDLGLVPTLRRATRDRGRRARVPVEFEVLGQDRRLPVEIESALFRILDEALAGYLAQGPDRVTLELDWTDTLDARIQAHRAPPAPPVPADTDELAADVPAGDEVPEALARMIEDRRASRAAAAEAARLAALVTLPASVRREIADRAASIEASLEILAEGSEVRVVVALPAPAETPADG